MYCSYQVVAQYEAYQNALGIRSMSFHRPPSTLDGASIGVVSNSPLLAVGSFDGSVRLLSTHSWQVAFVLPCSLPGDMMPGLGGEVVTTVEVLEAEDVSQMGSLGGTRGLEDASSLSDSVMSSYSTKYERVLFTPCNMFPQHLILYSVYHMFTLGERRARLDNSEPHT